MAEILNRFVWVVNVMTLTYFTLLATFYLVSSILAFRFLRRYATRLRSLDVESLVGAGTAPPVTLIVPAFNEERSCAESVRALLTLNYPEYEVIVVNDGSSDRTLEVLTETFGLVRTTRLPSAEIPTAPVRRILRSERHANLWVIDKENGGKSDALNAGLNISRAPLFCTIDADSILEPDALLRATRPFLEDDRMVAVGGIVRIVNGSTVDHGRVRNVRLSTNLLARLQVVEYLRAFLSARVAWSELNASLIISGAFGLFRRDIVVAAGGYSTETVGEDMDLVIRLHRTCRDRGMVPRVMFVPDPVAWTECPETLSGLARQRNRWQRGLLESLTANLGMFGNPRYGTVGLLAFPYFLLLEGLGPLIEITGYVAFFVTLIAGWWSPAFVASFVFLAIIVGIALSAAAVALEEMTFRRYARWSDLFRLFAASVVENLGYRQLNQWWRLQGTIAVLRGVRHWGAQQRQGFEPSAPGP
ncbi:MAG: glycosyltransferase [Gemmatimonadota bacterium]|nr:glycosyltransferase [Gemmatimonadota bacterium]MDH4349538.1 glycosyltransferase [Gemmatimonadota bacterium]MDH5198259.1 glycosyltransferase [Gemmatimonadota bacterium]